MTVSRFPALLAAVTALTLAGCGGGHPSVETAAGGAASSPHSASTAGTSVKTAVETVKVVSSAPASAVPPSRRETAPARSSGKPRTPPLLASLATAGRVEIVKTFPAGAPGVTGYLVKQGGRYSVMYGLAGGYLMAGALIGPSGTNLTASYQKRYAPRPDLTALVDKIDADPTVFTSGTSGPILYAFEDPNCIFCHHLEKAVEPLVKAGKLRVRYILVAFLKADSTGRAAAILAAKSPQKAMRENTAGYKVSAEEGGYPPLSAPSPDVLATLKKHMNWMEEAGSSGTPTLIYKDGAGHWAAKAGFPGADWVANYAAGASAPAGRHD